MASKKIKTPSLFVGLLLVQSITLAENEVAPISSYVGKSVNYVAEESDDTQTTLSLPLDTSIISASITLSESDKGDEESSTLTTIIRDEDDDMGLQLELSVDPDNADVVIPKVRFKYRGAYRTYKPKKTYRVNDEIDVFIEFKPENKVAELTLSGHKKPLYIPFWDRPSLMEFDCKQCKAKHVINQFEQFEK